MKTQADVKAQHLVDEFEFAANTASGGFSIRYGIAAVLQYLADNYAEYGGDEESFYAVPESILTDIVEALTAPTLLDRALAGDRQAARRFLREAGFTDQNGDLLPHFRLIPTNE